MLVYFCKYKIGRDDPMKITPYLNFNGNCMEAISLYEKAFGVKAQILRYKDAPPSEEYSILAGTENLVMHACLTNRKDYTVFLSDMPPNMSTKFGNGMSIFVELDSVEKVDFAFDTLKEAGKVTMPLGPTFWSKYFGSVEDRFGVNWLFSIPE
jgi:PhnB protein